MDSEKGYTATEVNYRSEQKALLTKEAKPVHGELQQQDKLLDELLGSIRSLEESLHSVLASSDAEVAGDQPETASYKVFSQIINHNYVISMAIDRVNDIKRRLEV